MLSQMFIAYDQGFKQSATSDTLLYTAYIFIQGRRKHLKSRGPGQKRGHITIPINGQNSKRFWVWKGHFCIVCQRWGAMDPLASRFLRPCFNLSFNGNISNRMLVNTFYYCVTLFETFKLAFWHIWASIAFKSWLVKNWIALPYLDLPTDLMNHMAEVFQQMFYHWKYLSQINLGHFTLSTSY